MEQDRIGAEGEKEPRKDFVAAAGGIYSFGAAGVELAGVEEGDAVAAFFLPRKRWPNSVAAVSNFARPNRLLATA